MFLVDKFRAYCLHESVISDVECIDSKLIMHFRNGFWKNHRQAENCCMVINIDGLTEKTVEFHTLIITVSKNKQRLLTYSKFLDLLRKSHFVIDVDYYSDFAKSILLLGYAGNHKVELSIFDIVNIEYVSD